MLESKRFYQRRLIYLLTNTNIESCNLKHIVFLKRGNFILVFVTYHRIFRLIVEYLEGDIKKSALESNIYSLSSIQNL